MRSNCSPGCRTRSAPPASAARSPAPVQNRWALPLSSSRPCRAPARRWPRAARAGSRIDRLVGPGCGRGCRAPRSSCSQWANRPPRVSRTGAGCRVAGFVFGPVFRRRAELAPAMNARLAMAAVLRARGAAGIPAGRTGPSATGRHRPARREKGGRPRGPASAGWCRVPKVGQGSGVAHRDLPAVGEAGFGMPRAGDR